MPELINDTDFSLRRAGYNITISAGRVHRTSASRTVDLGSIPVRVKPKTIQIGIYNVQQWKVRM